MTSKEWAQKWRQANPEKVKEIRKRWMQNHRDVARKVERLTYASVRLEVLWAYSVDSVIKCCQCGYNDIRALDIDHVLGDGASERKKWPSTKQFFYWLRRQGFPDKGKYRILCKNCNWIAWIERKNASLSTTSEAS